MATAATEIVDPAVTPEATPAPEAKPDAKPEATVDTAPETTPEKVEAEAETPAAEAERDVSFEELTDDELEAFSDAYLDRLLKTKRFGQETDRRIREESDKRVRETERTSASVSEIQRIVDDGRTALNDLLAMEAAARGELEKAAAEQDFKSDVLDRPKFLGNLQRYTQALQAEITHSFNSAFEASFATIFSDLLPPITEDHAKELAQIVAQAEDLQGSSDPRKAAQARPFFVAGMQAFIAKRAYEAGLQVGEKRAESRHTLRDRVADSNAVKVAKATLEAEKNPPPSPKGTPSIKSGAYTIDDYRKAKSEGNFDLAQEIVDTMARDGAGARSRV